MYNPKDELKVTDDRTNVEWEVPPPVIEFLFRPKAILFDVQDIEPQYFVSMALYDIDTKSKITETVYFDLSSKSLLVSHCQFNWFHLTPIVATIRCTLLVVVHEPYNLRSDQSRESFAGRY